MKNAHDHPIAEPIANHWSPYVYADLPVSDEDLLSRLEAARWAASHATISRGRSSWPVKTTEKRTNGFSRA